MTGDVVSYTFKAAHYDRVCSIELFEHMKNYELLMRKVAHTLKPGGKLFVHIFAHRSTPYDFDGGWMTEHFFTGGTMPSADLLHFFQRDLTLEEQWWVNGRHYAKTCEVSFWLLPCAGGRIMWLTAHAQDWLAKMMAHKKEIWPHLTQTYGEENTQTWYSRWEIFYMACAELFAFDGGDTWGVCHYLFSKPERPHGSH